MLREVEKLLAQKRAVGAKPLKEYMEVQGYADAAQWVYSQALDPDEWSDGQLVSLNEVRRIHHMAMALVWEVSPHPDATDAETPGNYRQHDIRAFSAGMTPPSWPDVPAQLNDWIVDVCSVGKQLVGDDTTSVPLAEQFAHIHNQFERVHPFLDGNGRTGRLALNLILVRLGHPPVIIFKKQREDYLKAMQRSDVGDHGPLGEIIARAMIDNLNRFIVPNVAGPARLVALATLADDDHTVAALRQAAQRGRLDAQQSSDGIWRSSRLAIEKYKKVKHDRRPKGD